MHIGQPINGGQYECMTFEIDVFKSTFLSKLKVSSHVVGSRKSIARARKFGVKHMHRCTAVIFMLKKCMDRDYNLSIESKP